MDKNRSAILWLRQDLRLADNPALQAAASHPLFAVYILDEEDPWAPGGASRWWLYKSLNDLKASCDKLGVQLVFRRGKPLQVLKALIEQTSAVAVYWNRCYEPYAVSRDLEVKSVLKSENIYCKSFKGSLLVEPWEIQTKSNSPYKVFTPFWNALQGFTFPKPVAIPECHGFKGEVQSDSLEDWGLKPTLWGQGLEDSWQPGEKGAWPKIHHFLDANIINYSRNRDFPSLSSTSQLSPYLHWGEISPLQVWHQACLSHGSDAMPFLRQLAWREFSYHLFYYHPDLPEKPLNSSFSNFPWNKNYELLQSWQRGLTGYPLVDAGMRELWHTGWMHNRVRMVVASFLVKDLLIPWQLGESWFWDTLVDADLANNSASWQWVAGCGADASPYFRIFNPILQSQKFDSNGDYIKNWVPELQRLPAPYIHSPWKSPSRVLEASGVKLGETYPLPIVDHSAARQSALSAYKSCRA